MNISEKIEIIISVNKHQQNGAKLWPFLIAHTGEGKSSTVAEYAKNKGFKLITLLLQTSLPEDVLGLPRVLGTKTVFTEPDWLTEAKGTPCVLFFDEADKPREENVSTILTLLSSLTVRGESLHPETEIILAGQPVEPDIWQSETHRALVARSVFLQYEGREFLERKYLLDLSWLPPRPAVEFPLIAYPSSRQMEWMIHLARTSDRESFLEISSGITSSEIADRLFEQANMENNVAITPNDLIESILKDIGKIETLPLDFLTTIGAETLLRGTPKIFARIVARLYREATPETRSQFIANLRRDMLREMGDQNEISIFGEMESEEVLRETTPIFLELANTLQARWKMEEQQEEQQ